MHAVVIAFFTADIAFMILYIGFHGLGNPLGSENPVLFDLNDEESLPTWYSSFKLLCVAFTFYFYGRIVLTFERIAGLVVFIFAFTFLYFSMDEGSALHERIGEWFDWFATGGGTSKNTPFHITGYWMFFLGPPALTALVAGFVFLKKRLSLPLNVFLKALSGIMVYIFAATIGDVFLNFITADQKIYQAIGEEGGEMLGITLIMWAAGTLLANEEMMIAHPATDDESAQMVSATASA
jgi:hypothetical protein